MSVACSVGGVVGGVGGGVGGVGGVVGVSSGTGWRVVRECRVCGRGGM